MATEQASERRASHMRGVTVTAVSTLAGVAAALVSAAVLGTAATDTLALAIVGGAVFAQLPLLRVLGIDVEDFSTKDHLYVLFMTFSLWFVTWTILLTNGVTF
ncbi:hypothetical protein NGM10_06145 [Halorussus salilacus]|uniref:EMC6-like membrane protein n=1 Tax=Halorussus salilacus TaxID=2953750 RepID=UPI0020A099DA|nr:hypothetical protein [Halorussus salilacus]USZ69315.1 hypothetical protein NGM10_06145 [Halorussus salilacus]